MIDLQFLLGEFAILCCPLGKKIGFYVLEDSQFGPASNFSFNCNGSNFISVFCTLKKLDKSSENKKNC